MHVTVILWTYNHQNYIQDCLNGINAQIVDRAINLVWVDDFSNDSTVELGKECLKNMPIQVQAIHNINNRRQRKIPVLLNLVEQIKGDYVFFIDGDDFWIDPNKIQKQINALELATSVNICFTVAQEIDNMNKIPAGLTGFYGSESKIFNSNQVILGDGGFMPTSSLCFRKKVFDNAPDWLFGYTPVLDYPLQVIGSINGGALYLPDVTTAYRKNVPGSWTEGVTVDLLKRQDFEVDFLIILSKLNKSYPGFKNEFSQIIFNHASVLLRLCVQNGNLKPLQRIANEIDIIY